MMVIKTLIILISFCFVGSCAMAPSSRIDIKYTAKIDSANIATRHGRDFVDVCVERKWKSRRNIARSSFFTISIPIFRDEYLQIDSLRNNKVNKFRESNGQLILEHRIGRGGWGWYSIATCNTNNPPIETIEVSVTNQTKVVLQGKEAIYYAYKDNSLISLGYISRDPFLNNQFSYAIEPLKSAFLKSYVKKSTPVEFSILKAVGATAGMVIIAPFVILDCITSTEDDCLK